MRDDLHECEQGIGQRRNLSVKLSSSQGSRLLLIAGVLVLGAAVVLTIAASRAASGGFFRPTPTRAGPASTSASNPVVLVSGRDDHGLQELALVPLFKAPDDTTVVAQAPDGSFARVVGQRGEWLQVQSIAPPIISGWVNDYYLRNRAIRTDGGGQVTFADARVDNNQLFIAIRPIDQPSASPTWIAASLLREIGVGIGP